jgi:site-specific DNA-methyltransferase (adenine-specific)
MARAKSKKPTPENKLIYGDNLDVLRQTEYFPGEMFDLIYLDPPFNSSANYNIIFRELDETLPASQVQTFQDTWTWDTTAQRLYQEVVSGPHTKVGQAMAAFYAVLGRSKMMAYLANMARD